MSPDTRVGQYPENAPAENFAQGITHVDIPELGKPSLVGKVRDNWIITPEDPRFRVLLTTDRVSAYDTLIAAIPRKGAVLNKTTEMWMNLTSDIMPNHMISVPHPNVMIARQAEVVVPVEVVVRRYFVQSATSTNIYRMYTEGYEGHPPGPEAVKAAYGIKLPEGLVANKRLPKAIVTPTTKSEDHDLPLTFRQAEKLVDSQFGSGMWEDIQYSALRITERAEALFLRRGIILADTKIEFGIDSKGEPMVIDELMTPDSSRLWLADSYEERMERGEKPENFDKEILRKYLAEHGFTGEGPIPVIPQEILDQMSKAYEVPYLMMTGNESFDAGDPSTIRTATVRGLASVVRTLT